LAGDETYNGNDLICERLMQGDETKANLIIKVENLGMSDTMRYGKIRLATFIITYSW